MALINCPECNKEISDRADICIHCGFPIRTYNMKPVEEPIAYCEAVIENEGLESVIEKATNFILKQTDIKKAEKPKRFVDDRRKNIYYSREKKPNFTGIYKAGGQIEVYCPRCGSSNCSHYKEQKIIPGKTKTRYTANLNPLRPFTLVNKKEKVVRKERVYTEDKFMCNRCGKIFY